jgi:MoxR-like ATPase
LRYVWDREEQIAPLRSLIGGVLEPYAGDARAHPLSAVPEQIDGEEIARQLDAVGSEVQKQPLSLTAAARLRERVADLSDRASWLTDQSARAYLLERSTQLLKRLGS